LLEKFKIETFPEFKEVFSNVDSCMSERSAKNKKRNTWLLWLIPLGGFVVGLVSTFLGITLPGDFLSNAKWFELLPPFQGTGVLNVLISSFFESIVFAFFAWNVSVLIHELGHAVMGWFNGFRMQYFSVGSLMIYREFGFWKTLWLKRPPAFGLYGGLLAQNDHLERRYAFMLLGGVLANGLTALIIYTALARFGLEIPPLGNPTWTSVLQVFSCWLLLINLALLFELLPIKIRGFLTDGAQLLRIVRRDPKFTRDTAISMLLAHARNGIPASAWDSKMIALATSIEDHSGSSVLAFWLAYYAAIDRNEIELAGQHIKHAFADIDSLAELERPNLHLEMAYFLAIHEGNVAEAKTALEHGHGQAVLPLVRLRAEAALAFAEQDYDEAIVKAESMLEDFRKRKEPVAARLEADQMRALITAAKQAKAQTA
jgi:hypothetical protein